MQLSLHCFVAVAMCGVAWDVITRERQEQMK